MLSLLFERLKPLSLITLLAFSLCVNAQGETFEEPTQQDRYQIEFIIFKHLNADETVLLYEDHAPLSIDNNIIEQTFLINSFEPLVSSQKTQLPIDSMMLKDSYQTLSRSIATRVLSHGAWIQSIDNDKTLSPLLVSRKLKSDQSEPTDIYSLMEGQTTIKRSRYMHAKFDLAINQYLELPYASMLDWFFDLEPFPTNWLVQKLQVQDTFLDNKGSSQVLLSSIKLQQTRRVKDGEVHYIDHPLLGVITTIKKLDPIPEYETF